MSKYCCLICKFETVRKNNYDTHLTSAKHLKKMNNSCSESEVSSVVSVATKVNNYNDNNNNNNENARIVDLENQLKIKDMEIKMKDEIIKHKDEIINMLTNKSIIKMNENVMLTVTEKVVGTVKQEKQLESENISELSDYNKKRKMPIIECLAKYRDSAPTIEVCGLQLIKDTFYNKYIVEIDENEKPIEVINYDTINLKSDDITDGITNNCFENAKKFITNFFNQFNKSNLPFYCSDKRRNVLYIKTEQGWIKNNEANMEKFNKYIHDFVVKIIRYAQKLLNNTSEVFDRHKSQFQKLYGLTYNDYKGHGVASYFQNHIIGLCYLIEDKEKMLGKISILLSELSLDFPVE